MFQGPVVLGMCLYKKHLGQITHHLWLKEIFGLILIIISVMYFSILYMTNWMQCYICTGLCSLTPTLLVEVEGSVNALST